MRRINNALVRADQIAHQRGEGGTHWYAPIVADAESGFGGPLNTYELMRDMLECGAAGVHFEDQPSSMKKCGHMGGKVLVPSSEFIHKLVAARLCADVMDIPTVIIARTDAESATLLRADLDETDRPFLTGEHTVEGYHVVRGGIEMAISRGLAYSRYADLVWCETSTPDLEEARAFAEGIHATFPGKPLAYNCSPSFNWTTQLDEPDLRTFQERLGEMGYRFQFVTLAGFHALNASIFELARHYREEGMAAYARVQEHEFALERDYGYRAVMHQSFVGAGYFDDIQQVVMSGEASTTALTGSTEEAQF